MKRLSTEAKHTIVKKALTNNDQSIRQIASENNVGFSTLAKWTKRYRPVNATINTH